MALGRGGSERSPNVHRSMPPLEKLSSVIDDTIQDQSVSVDRPNRPLQKRKKRRTRSRKPQKHNKRYKYTLRSSTAENGSVELSTGLPDGYDEGLTDDSDGNEWTNMMASTKEHALE